MKKLTLLISALFVLFIGYNAKAQITFEKSYLGINTEINILSCDTAENGNSILLASQTNMSGTLNFCLIKLNAYGDTLLFKPFSVMQNAEAQTIHYGNNHYYVMGIAPDTIVQFSNYMFWIVKFDLNGNSISTNFYSDNNIESSTIGFGDFEVFASGKLFCYSGFLPSFYNTDTSGILSNSKRYNFNSSSFPYMKSKLKSSNSIFHFSFLKNTNFQPPFIAKYVKLNEQLDTLSSIVISTDSSNGGIRLIKKESNKIIVFGCKPIPATIKPYFITAVDTLGQFLWRKKVMNFRFETTNITSHANLLNGTTVLCGFPYNPSQGPTGKAFLYCFNDNGDSLWYKEFSPTDSSLKTEFYDVIATSDSGLLACGQLLRSNGTRESYIVKLDASGNLYNPLSVVEKNQESYLHLYPNPAQDKVSVHFMGAAEQAVLRISTIDGREVYRHQFQSSGSTYSGYGDLRMNLLLDEFEPGLYFCSIYSNGKIIKTEKLVKLR